MYVAAPVVVLRGGVASAGRPRLTKKPRLSMHIRRQTGEEGSAPEKPKTRPRMLIVAHSEQSLWADGEEVALLWDEMEMRNSFKRFQYEQC